MTLGDLLSGYQIGGGELAELMNNLAGTGVDWNSELPYYITTGYGDVGWNDLNTIISELGQLPGWGQYGIPGPDQPPPDSPPDFSVDVTGQLPQDEPPVDNGGSSLGDVISTGLGGPTGSAAGRVNPIGAGRNRGSDTREVLQVPGTTTTNPPADTGEDGEPEQGEDNPVVVPPVVIPPVVDPPREELPVQGNPVNQPPAQTGQDGEPTQGNNGGGGTLTGPVTVPTTGGGDQTTTGGNKVSLDDIISGITSGGASGISSILNLLGIGNNAPAGADTDIATGGNAQGGAGGNAQGGAGGVGGQGGVGGTATSTTAPITINNTTQGDTTDWASLLGPFLANQAANVASGIISKDAAQNAGNEIGAAQTAAANNANYSAEQASSLARAGAGQASDALDAARNDASVPLYQGLEQVRDNTQPYRQGATNAYADLAPSISSPASFNYDDYASGPALDFFLSQGSNAIRNANVGKGTATSGNTLKALDQFGIGAGAQFYDQAHDRFIDDQNLNISKFNSLVQPGLTATGQLNNEVAQATSKLSDNAYNTGASRADIDTNLGQFLANVTTQGADRANQYSVGAAASRAGGELGGANALAGLINNTGNSLPVLLSQINGTAKAGTTAYPQLGQSTSDATLAALLQRLGIKN